MQSQFGISLIEILISLFILSLMLLGLDAMQIAALREAKSAYYFGVAAQQLDVMIERLVSLKDKNRDEQVAVWNELNHNVLPRGRGEVSGSYPDFTLSIFWGNETEKTCHKNKIGQSGCLRASITI